MMRSRMRFALMVTCAANVAVASGCADTAGDRVVAHDPISERARGLADTVVRYGHIDDHEPLYNVRNALWTDHGLVIGNSGAGQILVVDRAGSLRYTFGRVGSGPGEFRSLSSVWSVGDTIIGFDRALNKLEYFAPGAEHSIRAVALPSVAWHTVGVLEDGHIVDILVERQGAIPEGVQVADSALLRVSHPLRGTVDTVAQIPWQTRYGARIPSGQVIEVDVPLTLNSTVMARGTTLYIGTPSSWTVTRYSPGAGREELRINGQMAPLTTDMIRQWQDERAALTEVPRGEFMRYLRSLPYPDSLPAYDTFVPDASGRLAVRMFPLPGSTRAYWKLVDSNGDVVDVWDMPVYEYVTHLTSEYIVSVLSNPETPQVVTVYRRPPLLSDESQ